MNTQDYLIERFHPDITKRRMPLELLEANRTNLAKCWKELGFNIGVEVGVLKGEHAEVLCQHNPNLKLYCVDAWQGYRGYTDYLDKRLQSFYDEARERLASYNCVLVRKFSVEAAKDFADSSLDFVYLDGAHDFQNVVNDIAEWTKKVRPGGVLYGHDFKRTTNPNFNCHVVDAVGAWAYAHRINPWFVTGTRGAYDGQFRDGTRGWLWVKT